MEMKQKRPRRSFTPEFKAEVIELCRRGDRTINAVSRDLDLTHTSVTQWVRQADIDEGRRDGVTTAEHEEIVRLRTENRRLREDVGILTRATAFFAKGTR